MNIYINIVPRKHYEAIEREVKMSTVNLWGIMGQYDTMITKIKIIETVVDNIESEKVLLTIFKMGRLYSYNAD